MSSQPSTPICNLSVTVNSAENINKSDPSPTATIPEVKYSSHGKDASTCLNTNLSIPNLVSIPSTQVVASGVCPFSSSTSTNASSTIVTSPGAVITSTNSISSNDSKPVRDLKLEAALNGQEPTVRNLIMAAIGVMKNRKVC